MKLKNKKIGILGGACSGLAAARKAKQYGAEVFLSEFKKKEQISNSEELEEDFQCEFGGHSQKLLEMDFIVVSPGIPSQLTILKKAKEKNIEVISEIEFAFRFKHNNSKIIAVTGSNGKSTTVSLIAEILKNSGYRTILAGNIGKAFSSFPIEDKKIDFIVLELSSFQLELLDQFKAEVAVLLNISPDHLNRYKDLNDYANTKFNIFQNQTTKDLAILNFDDEFCRQLENKLKATTKYFSLKEKKDIFMQNHLLIWNKSKLDISNSNLKGPHNIANIMAAILATSEFKINNLEQTINNFQPLAHRMEVVDKINGITFINDSKATNTESVKYALQSFSKPVNIIMGGQGKNEDYSVLNKLLKQHAKKIYLIGSSTEDMENAFQNIVATQRCKDLKEAVIKAYQQSKKEDIILLSPACTSYDMFQNFEVRGNIFKKIVRDIKNDE